MKPLHPIHLILGIFSRGPEIIRYWHTETPIMRYRFAAVYYLAFLLLIMVPDKLNFLGFVSATFAYVFTHFVIALPALVVTRKKGDFMYKVSSLLIDGTVAMHGYLFAALMFWVVAVLLSNFLLLTLHSVLPPFGGYMVAVLSMYSLEFARNYTDKIKTWHMDVIVLISYLSGFALLWVVAEIMISMPQGIQAT